MKSIYKMWKTLNKARKIKEMCINTFNEGGDCFANIKCAFNANLLINNSGVLYNTPITAEYLFIRIENIKKVQVKTDEELTKQIVDNKIPIIGNLTFPKGIHFFLIINYTENSLEIEKTIESEMSVFGAASILKARKEYIKIHPESFLEELDYTFEPKNPNNDLNTMDIPDQINKLFELVEKGALSLEEFNQKEKRTAVKNVAIY